MVRINIGKIPEMVKHLHNVYKFESLQAISRYLYTEAIRRMGQVLVVGNDLEDFDADWITDELDRIIDGLPKIHTLQSTDEPRDIDKLKEDVVAALGFVILSISGEVIGNAFSREAIEDLKVSDIDLELKEKTGKYYIGYHDLGHDSYAISVREEDDLEFDQFILDIMDYRKVQHDDNIHVIDLGDSHPAK